MVVDAHALEFLSQLEKAETTLLSWGLIDGFFSEGEIEERAERFLAELNASGASCQYESAWDLVELLLEHHLIWRVPELGRYRTRMAEAVRLLARLRQIFPDANHLAWRTAPSLVADYRLVVRPRMFPHRDVPPSELIQTLRQLQNISSFQHSVVAALVRAGSGDERSLAKFQARSAERILRESSANRSMGTVVSAGTGSGKTMAFYLPAYAVIAERVSAEYWTKCLALYPRNELLKDQLREALTNAQLIAPVLAARGRRKFVIGALYGDVPYTGSNLLDNNSGAAWRRVSLRGESGYECPFVRCTHCGQGMVWLERDLRADVERLTCSNTDCHAIVGSDEIRLTRRRMLAEPPDILFTSTEMLNQRLSSTRFARLLGIGVRADRRPEFVLVDEVHAYEGVHGAHVALLLRRWRRASDARPHFVGLSATLADAPRFFGELVGLGPGDVNEIRPEPHELMAKGAEYMLALRGDPSSGTSLLSTTIQALMLLRRTLGPGPGDSFGSRVFAFTDNLDVINRLYHNLLDAEGWDAFGRPNPTRADGSLANLRCSTLPNARERLECGQNWALVEDIGNVLAPGSRVRVGRTSSQDSGVDVDAGIVVATASLEVGFDDPEVGAVFQHKTPHSSAAFLQRKGRAGRRQEMRPWTVVSLSDYGRDRSAYQAYDQLFSPNLPPRHLPLGNRAVLRIQATYCLCDWLARRLPQGHSPDPWSDFSQPAGELLNTQAASELAARQVLYVQYLKALLEEHAVRDDFSAFVARSLSVERQEAQALLWEPPRALMTEAIPTLLRRLERGWRRAASAELETHTARLPMPEFLPRTLFSDLQVPDVAIRLPAIGRNEARIESMPIAQALREFAPGRVSRRFGVSHGGERHWVDPGNGDTVLIDRFCPVRDRLDLGNFRYVTDEGAIREVPVFRPYAMDIALAPLDIQQSSNSFLRWRTEILPTDNGHQLDLPTGAAWGRLLQSFSVHTHYFGTPIELRRFSTGATASVGRGRQTQVARNVDFACAAESGEVQVGVGFAADVDAIRVSFQYPHRLYELCTLNAALVRGLRTARFRDLVRATKDLDGIANIFQRDWLSQAYVSTVTAEALRGGASLQAAESDVFRRESTTTIREVLNTILQWGEGEAGDGGGDLAPRRLQELADLLHLEATWNALHLSAEVLWEPIDLDWEAWLRARFKSTLGAALVDAAHSLCPRMNADALAVDLNALISGETSEPGVTRTSNGEVWLTETTIGGGGFVEEFVARYAEDPRRYFRLLDAALEPSDLECVGDELGHLLDLVVESGPDGKPVSAAVAAIRTADSHEASARALSGLRAELARVGIQPTATLLVSVNTRLLAPGTNVNTDRFLANALHEWESAEQRLGVDIDARVFALVKSSAPGLEQALGVTAVGTSDSARAAWRFGGLSGMLWPRGAQVRTEAMRVWNPYERPPDCDRLLLLAALSRDRPEVQVSSGNWFVELTELLLSHGSVELVAGPNDVPRLAEALLWIGEEPVDSEAILVHARVTGVRREGNRIKAAIELPEAFQ